MNRKVTILVQKRMHLFWEIPGRSGQGAGVGVGMLRGAGDSLEQVNWFRGFLVFGFLVFGFLVSWFQNFLVSWFRRSENPLMFVEVIRSISPQCQFHVF